MEFHFHFPCVVVMQEGKRGGAARRRQETSQSYSKPWISNVDEYMCKCVRTEAEEEEGEEEEEETEGGPMSLEEFEELLEGKLALSKQERDQWMEFDRQRRKEEMRKRTGMKGHRDASAASSSSQGQDQREAILVS